jgi:hypothetical protein
MSHRDPTSPLPTKILFRYLERSDPNDLGSAQREALAIDRSRGKNLLKAAERELLSTDSQVLARQPSKLASIRVALRIVALAYMEPFWKELMEQHAAAISAIEANRHRPIVRELPKFATATEICALRDRYDQLAAQVAQYQEVRQLERRRKEALIEHEEAFSILAGRELTEVDQALLKREITLTLVQRTRLEGLTQVIGRFITLAEELEISWVQVNLDAAQFIEQHADFIEASAHPAIPVLLEELAADAPLVTVRQRRLDLEELRAEQVKYAEEQSRCEETLEPPRQNPNRFAHAGFTPTAQAA